MNAAPRIGRAAALGGLFVFVLGLALVPMAETDLFFRLAVGARISATRAVPKINLFSFTHPDHPDLDSAWLFDLMVYGLHQAGGFKAVVVAKAVLVGLACALVVRVCRARGAGVAASTVTVAAAALVASERFVERPHVVSFIGVAATLLLVQRVCDRPGWLWAALPLAAAWANLHAGAFLAAVLLSAAAAGAFIDERRLGGPRRAPALMAAAALAAGGLLLTPVGTGVLSYLAFHIDIFSLHPIDEFRPPTPWSDGPLFVYAAALVATLVLLRGPQPVRARDLLPVLAVAVLTTRAVRFAADFAFVAAPLFAERLSAAAARVRPPLPTTPTRGLVAIGLALCAAAILPRALQTRTGQPFVDVDLAADVVPFDAIKFIDENGLGDGLYNDMELGGYLAWTGHRVFFDPRLPAYPRTLHALLGRIDVSREEWDRALTKYGVKAALLQNAGINPRIAWWDPTAWALVYRAQDARVFVRRTDEHRALIMAKEIPATFAYTHENGAETLPLYDPPIDTPVPSCEWELRLGDLFFDLDDGQIARALPAYRRALAMPDGCLTPARTATAGSWVGAVLLERDQAKQALAALDRAHEADPADQATQANRALALERLGRTDEARAAWLQAEAAAPDSAVGKQARARAARLKPTLP